MDELSSSNDSDSTDSTDITDDRTDKEYLDAEFSEYDDVMAEPEPTVQPGRFRNLEEKFFRAIRRKGKDGREKSSEGLFAKIRAFRKTKETVTEPEPAEQPDAQPAKNPITGHDLNIPQREPAAPEPAELPKKNKFAFVNATVVRVIVSGIALCVFAAGAYIVYKQIPLHPEIVLGIVLMAVSANLLTRG